MTQAIQKKLNDSAFARWTALILVALTMFFGYMFVDMMSPLQSMIEAQRGWTPDVFGMYGSSEFIFNVFGFLILAGIILDKMGVRFTGMLSASLMFIGACIKYYGVSDAFIQAVLDDQPDLSGHQVYACGAPIVVDSARAAYSAERGLPPDEFFADSFTSEADKHG